MAVSGGATSAYKMQITNGVLVMHPTTCLSSLCDKPAAAVAKIRAGDETTVASGDAYAVHETVTGKGLHGERVAR